MLSIKEYLKNLKEHQKITVESDKKSTNAQQVQEKQPNVVGTWFHPLLMWVEMVFDRIIALLFAVIIGTFRALIRECDYIRRLIIRHIVEPIILKPFFIAVTL